MSKPILGLDIDGVLNAFASPYDLPTHTEMYVGGFWVLLNTEDHPKWIAELEEYFDIVWATMWTHNANELIAPIMGIGPFPVIDHNDIPEWVDDSKLRGIDGLKIATIDPFVGDRPFAWIDDDISAVARKWAGERNAPTKLVKPNPTYGLQRDHIDQLIEWAKGF